MNNTPGLEEELKTRLSEIVNKDLSKRQVGKIVELFAPDKGNTITDEELKKAAIILFENHNPDIDTSSIIGERLIDGFYNDLQYLSRYYEIVPKHKANPLHQQITHFHVADNSNAFHDWLKQKGIEYVPNGHFTSIPLEGNDIFSLGSKFALYKQKGTANPLYRVVDEKSFRNWFFENFTERGDDELNHVNIAPHDLCKELYKYFQFKHSLPVSDEGWISIENQLPPIGEEVIVYCPECRKKITALARLIRYEGAINFYWDNSYGGSNIHVQTSVTHWRKLPNKPNSK